MRDPHENLDVFSTSKQQMFFTQAKLKLISIAEMINCSNFLVL